MNAGGEGLIAYDLTPPARILLPNMHRCPSRSVRGVILNEDGDEDAVLRVTTWDECRGAVSGHPAGRSVVLTVPCDSLPHCNACECGSEHTYVLGEATVAGLLAVLS